MHKTINKESSEILYVRSDKSYKAAAYENIKNPFLGLHPFFAPKNGWNI